MAEDIRKHIAYLVNEIRRTRGWNDGEMAPLHLHFDESAACKKHAEHMAGVFLANGQLYHSPREFRHGWRESLHVAWSGDHPYQVVEKMLQDLDEGHLRRILDAREFVAADVAVHSHGPHRKMHVFMCVRLK